MIIYLLANPETTQEIAGTDVNGSTRGRPRLSVALLASTIKARLSMCRLSVRALHPLNL
jgi:hypothetical protein